MGELEPYRLTASQALELFRSGTLSVERYAESLRSRYQARDSAVEAWAYIDWDLVLEQAKALDQVPSESRGHLHGVAIGVKDVMSTKDMPTRYNSPIHKDNLPTLDAASVAILRREGALILGKTTTTEFAAVNEGPKTHNPHNLAHTPGGSSSGSGAAVADMQVAIGLGTQTGGSIIRPASFNGVYAIKPTWNSISPEGQKVFAITLDTFGFMARSIDDLQLVADVFGLGRSDEESAKPIVLSECKIALVKSPAWPKAGPGTIAAMDRAAKILKEAGVAVEELALPPEFDYLPIWSGMISEKEGSVSFYREYVSARDQISNELAELVEDGMQISDQEFRRVFDGVAALRPKFDDIARRYTAIITPSAVDEAPEGLHWTGSVAFNNSWTGLHCPVVNLPGFKGEHDLPIGLSIVTSRGRDAYLLRVAKEVGDLFASQGGWKSDLST